MTTAHAATVIGCAGDTSLDIGNSTTSGTPFIGTWTVGPSTCAFVDSSGGVFGAVTVEEPPTFTASYTYSGTCAEGTMSFGTGIGVFVAGLFVIEGQQNGRALEYVGALHPATAVGLCTGTPATMTWKGVAAGTGV